MLHFPCSAHRLQPTQATISSPTTHPVFQYWPHSTQTFHRWEQSCMRGAFSVHASVTPQPRDRRLRGGVEGHGGGVNEQQHHTPYLSWQCKRGTAANEWNNIQAVLHSVVTAAWLFICVPPSEEEAAPIGFRCERKDRQQPDWKMAACPRWTLCCCRATAPSLRQVTSVHYDKKKDETTFTFRVDQRWKTNIYSMICGHGRGKKIPIIYHVVRWHVFCTMR